MGSRLVGTGAILQWHRDGTAMALPWHRCGTAGRLAWHRCHQDTPARNTGCAPDSWLTYEVGPDFLEHGYRKACEQPELPWDI